MNRVVSIIIIACLAITACTNKVTPPNPPVPVNIIKVASKQVLYYDKYPATTQALSQVNITAQVQGYITGIYFTEGSYVRQGQLLYDIDKRLYEASVNGAEANLKVAQGNLVQAQQDADRYDYLNNQNAVAKQVYDHAVIALQNAKNQVKAAEEQLKTAKTNLEYSRITAPFEGTIGFSQVKMGNLVTVGQTILNTISTNNPMAVDFLVNEKQLMAFESFQNGKARVPDSLFTILMPDNSVYPYTGKISVIDRAVDPQTGAIRIRLEFPNPENILKAGMSCVVRVHNLEPAPVVVIPGKAVIEQMGEYFVFVAKDTLIEHHGDSTRKKEAAEPDTAQRGPKYYAFQRKVTVGQTVGGNVVIKEGISEGDSLIVDGVQLLHDGSRINIGSKPATKDKEGNTTSENASAKATKKE